MSTWREIMRRGAARIAVLPVLLVAAACGASDESRSLPEVPVSRVVADGTEQDAAGAEPSPSSEEAGDRPELLVIDGPSTAVSTSQPTASDPSSTDTTAPTNTAASTTAASNATASTATSTAPSTTEPPETTAAPTTEITLAPTTTEPPPERPGSFINVNFQSTPTGTYDDQRIRADWGDGAVRYTSTDGRAVIVDEGGNRFVRIRFPQGKVGPSEGGSQWAVNLGSNSSDELFISYRVRFVGNFDFVRGGKLPGLSGGDSNTGGRKPNGNDGWSSRIMWRPEGAAVQYVYHPDQPTIYGDDMSWGQTFPADRWVRVETRIRMNTPGQRDGIVQSWMDGRLVLDRTDVRFRDTADFEIDRFLFDTFFGGNSPEWAPSKQEHIDFDDFVVSGSPITH